MCYIFSWSGDDISSLLTTRRCLQNIAPDSCLSGILFVLKIRKSAAETELIILTPKKIFVRKHKP